MLYFRRNLICLLPDTGSGNGGSAEGNGENGEGGENKAGETEESIKAMKAELETLRKEKAERAKAEEKEKRERMTEEQKARADIEKERVSLLEEHKMLCLKSAGIGEEYAPLLTGKTSEEIKKNGELLASLIAKITADTEARVKKGLAQTGTPGTNKEEIEISDEEYYRGILEGGRK